MQHAQCIMHQAIFKMDNAHHIMYVRGRKSHRPCHTSKHALHLLRVCVLPLVFFSHFPIYPNLNMCVSPVAVVSVYSLATIYIFRCMFSRVLFVLVCTVLSFMQSQQVTHQSFRRFHVSYRVYLCLEF